VHLPSPRVRPPCVAPGIARRQPAGDLPAEVAARAPRQTARRARPNHTSIRPLEARHRTGRTSDDLRLERTDSRVDAAEPLNERV
jgi:hypothetical protein